MGHTKTNMTPRRVTRSDGVTQTYWGKPPNTPPASKPAGGNSRGYGTIPDPTAVSVARKAWLAKNQEKGKPVGEPHRITRDEIVNPDNRFGQNHWTYACVSATGAEYDVISTTGDGSAYGISHRTGLVVRIVPTGTKMDSRGWVTCRVDFPVDTGDAAGTLEFRKRTHDTENGGAASVKGYAPSSMFLSERTVRNLNA